MGFSSLGLHHVTQAGKLHFAVHTEHSSREDGWKVESTFQVSSYVACKKVINLLQDKESKNCMTADSKNYPFVAMTLARFWG